MPDTGKRIRRIKPDSVEFADGVDIELEYCRMALRRLDSESGPLFAGATIEYRAAVDLLAPATAIAVADGRQRGPTRTRRAGRAHVGPGLSRSPRSSLRH